MRIRSLLTVVGACLIVQGCAMNKDYSRPLPPGEVALRKITDPRMIPDFKPAFMDREGLIESIDISLHYYTYPSSQRFFPYRGPDFEISHTRAVRSLEEFKRLLVTSPSASEFQRRIVNEFDVFVSVGYNGRGTVLFTGYCTPIYHASLTRTPEYRYPLYKQPPDLIKGEDGAILGQQTAAGTLRPYPTRAEIQRSNMLAGQELVYLRCPLEAYLVHVQGSAKLVLPNGSPYEVGYAAKNGREYSSLGQRLADDGKIRKDRVSLTSIKEYFQKNPQDLDKYLVMNDSFVFFREAPGGPFGSLGQPVTPYRSIATDKNRLPEIYPRGGLSYIVTTLPAMQGSRVVKRPYSGFILDQDTGGAIRSAGRADVYMGTGPEAERLAGHTVAEGRIYYLFVKTAFLDRSM